ncbi:kinase-like domain-containing protein [Chaetomidium leptoderma]|uniref:Kinase-like domain-containing protein n=1 Tax=Chaetomidium leptoderma TaxID=669021 RepID=A0AAN6VGG0_9PEZI|nr:kinase-like domain-containing protein [Chaetomidium leptoderma]
MGDPGDGWQTVMPTSHLGMQRLPQSQLEACERQILEEWDASRHHWSGIGKHAPLDDYAEAKKLHERFVLDCGNPLLGSGSFGIVQKVQYQNHNRSICLARKQIRQPYRRYPMEKLREEANVMEKLCHDHIVKLVGTYCLQTNLYLLLWPVAVCNLDCLLTDIDNIRAGHGDQEDATSRLHKLGLRDLAAIKEPRAAERGSPGRSNCPLQYLRQIMGCITQAVAYCHRADIRHLDLKPSNILLTPGGVYLADFGIAKDVHDRENTMTIGVQGTPKWRAPELQYNADWSMKAADVYSLGLVLLNIAATIHHGPLDEFDAVLRDVSKDGRDEKLHGYLRRVEGLALATQEVDDADAPTFNPKHIVHLVSRMVSKEPSSRPVIFQVNNELVELGGIDQVYHAACCKRSSRFVTDRMNTRLKLVADERDRLRAEHGAIAKRLQVLEAKDETYVLRIENERRTHADNIAALQAQLDKERNERKRLEGLVAGMQQNRRQPRPGLPRPAADRAGFGSPSPGGLVTRTQRPHPGPSAAAQQRSPPFQIQQPSPAPSVGHSPRPSYCQAAAAIPPQQIVALAAPPRRDSLIPSPSPAAVPVDSRSPDLVGFPLRSRNSGSRLPLAVNPMTPIRSNTPILKHDLSSTDSTQYSMSSSVFSRMSLSKASLAETSVAGTPPTAHSPAMMDTRGASSSTVVPIKARYEEPLEMEHGLGLGLTDRERRESITSGMGGGDSIQDTASIASSAAIPPGTPGSMLSGSAFSSPRAAHASLEAVRGAVKVPPLPTAKSWADIARKQKRG